MRALHTAATGMMAQELNVQVISNNIANMRTTGYKRQRAEFQDMLYEQVRRVGSQSSDTGTILPSGAQIGLGVKTSAIYRIAEQGDLQQTENRFDLAIRGNGYFQVQLPSGEIAYTRDGTFGLSPEGTPGALKVPFNGNCNDAPVVVDDPPTRLRPPPRMVIDTSSTSPVSRRSLATLHWRRNC